MVKLNKKRIMKDDDKEFRYTSYPSGLPKIYVEEDDVELEENNEGNIKKLLKRAPLKILLLFMIIGAALTIWIVR